MSEKALTISITAKVAKGDYFADLRSQGQRAATELEAATRRMTGGFTDILKGKDPFATIAAQAARATDGAMQSLSRLGAIDMKTSPDQFRGIATSARAAIDKTNLELSRLVAPSAMQADPYGAIPASARAAVAESRNILTRLRDGISGPIDRTTFERLVSDATTAVGKVRETLKSLDTLKPHIATDNPFVPLETAARATAGRVQAELARVNPTIRPQQPLPADVTPAALRPTRTEQAIERTAQREAVILQPDQQPAPVRQQPRQQPIAIDQAQQPQKTLATAQQRFGELETVAIKPNVDLTSLASQTRAVVQSVNRELMGISLADAEAKLKSPWAGLAPAAASSVKAAQHELQRIIDLVPTKGKNVSPDTFQAIVNAARKAVTEAQTEIGRVAKIDVPALPTIPAASFPVASLPKAAPVVGKQQSQPLTDAQRVAAENREALRERLERSAGRLRDVSTGSQLVNDQIRSTLGITNADKALGPAVNRIKAKLNEIRLDAGDLKIDGDPGPILNKLNRVEMTIGRVKTAVKESVSATFASGQRAITGGQDLARGVSVLGAGNKSAEQMVQGLLHADALIGVFRGSKEIIVGFVGSIANAGKALKTMGIAADLAKSFGVAQEALLSKVATTTVAQTVGTAGGTLIANASGAAIGAGAATAATTAAPAAAVAAGSAPAAGAAAGTTAARGMAAWLVPVAGVAALAAGAFAAVVLSSEKLQNSLAWTADYLPKWLPSWSVSQMFGGHGERIDRNMLDVAGSEDRLRRTREVNAARQDLFAQTGFTHLDMENQQRDQLRHQAEDRERAIRREIAIEPIAMQASNAASVPLALHERTLARQTVVASQAHSDIFRSDATADTFARAQRENERVTELTRGGGQGSAAIAGRLAEQQARLRREQSELAGMDAQLRPAQANQQQRMAATAAMRDADTRLQAANQAAERASARLAAIPAALLAGTGPTAEAAQREHASARQAQGEATMNRQRAMHDRGRAMQQMSAAGEGMSGNDLLDLERRREESARRVADAQKQIVSLQRDQRQNALEILDTEAKRWRAAADASKQAARALRDEQRGDKGSFGLMSADKQEAARDIAVKLSKRQDLSEEEQQLAQSIGPLRDMMASLGREQSDRNGFFRQIEQLARPGDMSREQRAQALEGDARRNETHAVTFENQVKIALELNANQNAADIRNIVQPALERMLTDVRADLIRTLTQQNADAIFRNLQALQANQGPQQR